MTSCLKNQVKEENDQSRQKLIKSEDVINMSSNDEFSWKGKKVKEKI